MKSINQIRRHCAKNHYTPKEAAKYFLSLFPGEEHINIVEKLRRVGVVTATHEYEEPYLVAITRVNEPIGIFKRKHIIIDALCYRYNDGDLNTSMLSFIYACELGWLLLGNQNAKGHFILEANKVPAEQYEEFASYILVPPTMWSYLADISAGADTDKAINYISIMLDVPPICVAIAGQYFLDFSQDLSDDEEDNECRVCEETR